MDGRSFWLLCFLFGVLVLGFRLSLCLASCWWGRWWGSVLPLQSLPDDPLLNNMNGTSMSSYNKGQLGVKEAMKEFVEDGGTVYQTEVSVDLPHTLSNGKTIMVRNRFDFAGELDGKLHLFEVKNGASAGFTPNQKINLPKMIFNHPQFTPVGRNALQVPHFQNNIGIPYTGNYVIIVKHYF